MSPRPTVKLYLDMCALKRPFDDQTQARIWLETQAVIRILEACHLGELSVVNSRALMLENSRNPKPDRRDRVAVLLRSLGDAKPITEAVLRRALDIRALGFGDMDALHVATAESEACDWLLTCDDGMLSRCARTRDRLRVAILDPTGFLKESR